MAGNESFLAAVRKWVEREEATDPWTDPLESDRTLKKALSYYPPPEQQWKWLQDFLAKTSKWGKDGNS
ncbi:hypothetical protein [Streptomyces agglomeratus]|uniref:hypothetical protein n=1 Tax=Streptomyces agglomeratus TaxID=285458 RepID=UPI00114CF5F5|nr:hypothetical protein [Streptomyces agglomeratus]